jgi:hypothetical protein
LNAPARKYLCDAKQHAAGREREKHRGEIEYGHGLAFLDGVEDRAVPDVDAILDGDDQKQQSDRKQPCSRSPFLPQYPRALIQNRVSR